MSRLRLLFVKQSQSWPRSSGHDVHGYHMMQGLANHGHAVSLATIVPPTEQALEGLKLTGEPVTLVAGVLAKSVRDAPGLSHWQRRFTRYFGVPDEPISALAELLHANRYDAVIVVARHLLPLLAAVKNALRIWYPADDPALHHLTRLKPLDRRTWGEAKRAIVNGLFERAFRGCLDRVWVVSPPDRKAMRLITGCRNVDLIANGVDAEHYRPQVEESLPLSCVFWGRLDFGPNLDALRWFLRSIWPSVKVAQPAANFHVFGFNPTEEVRNLVKLSGVALHPDLPDLRSEVAQRQVVVLPFISGGGIKNKLLEAAAMGMPIVCTRQALSGTKGNAPVRIASRPREWSQALRDLWNDAATRQNLGTAARDWVVAHHTWDAAARTAECGIERSMRPRYD